MMAGITGIFNISLREVEQNEGTEEERIVREERALKKELIWNVVSTSLTELAVCLALTGVICYFTATAISTFLIATITAVAFATLFHFIESYLFYEMRSHVIRGDYPELSYSKLYPFYLESMWLRCFSFARYNMHTHGTFVHELGHALTAMLLFKNANPKIEFFAGGGATSFNAIDLTKWGQWLGRERSFLVIVAAGTTFSILEATALLVIAHLIKDRYPELRLYLVSMALFRISIHVFYALSALLKSSAGDSGHDFVLLRKLGIHPIVAAVTIVAIPLLVQCALWKIARNNSSV